MSVTTIAVPATASAAPAPGPTTASVQDGGAFATELDAALATDPTSPDAALPQPGTAVPGAGTAPGSDTTPGSATQDMTAQDLTAQEPTAPEGAAPATPGTRALPAGRTGAAEHGRRLGRRDHEAEHPVADPATPAVPAVPAVPATPATPAAPAIPAAPATRATPAVPADPATSATPAVPATPEVPADDAEPGIPATPTTPATPAEPVHPVRSHGAHDEGAPAAAAALSTPDAAPASTTPEVATATTDPGAAAQPDATSSVPPVPGTSPVAAAAAPTTSTAPEPASSAPVVPAHVAEQLSTHLRGVRRTTDGRHEATLILDPEHLGPVRVRLTLDDGALHLQLSSLAASTGDALRDALPDLRRQLADAGLTLGSANVTDQGAWDGRDAHGGTPQPHRQRHQLETHDRVPAPTILAAPVRPPRAGGVDLVV